MVCQWVNVSSQKSQEIPKSKTSTHKHDIITIATSGLVANLCVSGNTDVFDAGSTQSSDSPTDCIEKCFMEGSTHMGLTVS